MNNIKGVVDHAYFQVFSGDCANSCYGWLQFIRKCGFFPASGSPVNIKSDVLGEKSFTGLIIKGHTYVDLDGFVNCLPFQINSKALSFQSETKTFKVLNEDFAIPTPELQFKVGSDTFNTMMSHFD